MLRLALAAVAVTACLAVSVVEDCGPSDAYIKFHKLDISPMPFNILGKIQVEADVETRTQIGNKVRMTVNLKKSNLKGKFTWEVPCTNIGLIGGAAQGITGYLGTCDYEGSCDFPFIKTWTGPAGCPDFFKEYEIPCVCPFPAKRFTSKKKFDVDLSQFKDKMPKWLIEGGYIVKAELRDTTNNDKLVGCVKLNFEIIAEKPCPEVLKKVNACP